MCVEGFLQLLEIVEGEWPEMMEEFLAGVVPADKDDGDLCSRAHYVIKTFQVRYPPHPPVVPLPTCGTLPHLWYDLAYTPIDPHHGSHQSVRKQQGCHLNVRHRQPSHKVFVQRFTAGTGHVLYINGANIVLGSTSVGTGARLDTSTCTVQRSGHRSAFWICLLGGTFW